MHFFHERLTGKEKHWRERERIGVYVCVCVSARAHLQIFRPKKKIAWYSLYL